LGIIEDSRGIIHTSRGINDDSRGLIDDSRGIIEDSRGITDDSRTILQLVASFTIVIYDHHILKVQATGPWKTIGLAPG
jgi:hypothetical protein